MQEVPAIDVARLWLGCIWISAGVLKAVRPAAAQAYVKRRIRISADTARPIVAAICVSEIAIGASLLAGLMVTQAAGLAVVLLAVFTLIVTLNPEKEIGCGCFGALDAAVENHWAFITRNVVMSTVALFIFLGYRPLGSAALISEPLTWLFAIALVGLAGIGYFVGVRLLLPPNESLSRISKVQ